MEDLKEAFDLMSTGLYSCEEVRREMKKKGCNLSKQPFINMLKNIAYTGQILIPEWRKEEAIIVSGLHEGIIQTEIFNRVQEILLGRRKQPKFHIRKSELLPLRGHLICPKCGGNLTGSGSTGRAKIKHYYYHCQKGCKIRFRANLANTKFIEYLSSLKISEAVKELFKNIMREIYREREGDKSKKIALINHEIEITKERIGNIQDQLADNHITPEEFRSIKDRCDDRIFSFQKELSDLKVDDINFLKYIDFTLFLAEKMDYFYAIASVDIKQKILVSMFSEKLIFDGEKYRTTKMNEVMSLITNKDNKIRRNGKEKADKNIGLSFEAPPSGLEPETL